jgi:hypothetical protein
MVSTTLETAGLAAIGSYVAHSLLHVSILGWTVSASFTSEVSYGMAIVGFVGAILNHLWWENRN